MVLWRVFKSLQFHFIYHKLCITIVSGQAPASCDTPHATWEAVSGRSQTHRGHTGAELGGRGQFDHSNVIVDGVWIVVGVPDGLYRRENGYNESKFFYDHLTG